MSMTDDEILAEGCRVFNLERQALEKVENDLGAPFVAAVRLILQTKGNVIFSGVGKSGHIGRKLAATFSSTGTTSFFVHSDEAAHGDLGMIRPGDVFVGISFSGEMMPVMDGLEATRRIRAMKRPDARTIPIIAMTGKPRSSLARVADVALVTAIDREACPLNLAPTASTTVTMALGDAIAGALIIAKSFSAEDFARSHPAGALGRRLLMKVSDVMRGPENLPTVGLDDPAMDALDVLAKKHLGCFVVTDHGKLAGIFTEGDFIRALKNDTDLKSLKARDLMNPTPKSVQADESAFYAMSLIRKFQINQLVVVDDRNAVVGLVHIHDLVAAKIN